jgi:opacity protein-like surface antigen
MPRFRVRAHPAVLAALFCLTLVAAASAETVKVTVDRSTIWRNPSGVSGVLTVVRSGTVLEVRGREGRWLLVELPGDPKQTGYILENQTEPVTGGTSSGAAPSARAGTQTRGASGARPGAPRGPRSFVAVGAVVGIGKLSFEGTDTQPLYQETQTLTSKYSYKSAPGFEASAGTLFTRAVGVSAAVSRISSTKSVTVTGSIPHPFYFGQPRTLSGQVQALREETAVHVQVFGVSHLSPRFEVSVGAGPSFFLVTQDIVQNVTYSESYPFDTVTFTGATLKRESKNRVGYNVQVGVGVAITRMIAWQTNGRWSNAKLTFDQATKTLEAEAGRGQVSTGIRFNF